MRGMFELLGGANVDRSCAHHVEPRQLVLAKQLTGLHHVLINAGVVLSYTIRHDGRKYLPWPLIRSRHIHGIAEIERQRVQQISRVPVFFFQPHTLVNRHIHFRNRDVLLGSDGSMCFL